MDKEYIGIDVSKATLDVFALQANKLAKFENSVKGIEACIGWIREKGEVEAVVFEPSGGYEETLHDELIRARLKTWRVNPSLVRHFIKSEGVKAKTDRIDAKMLARYGKAKEKPYEPIPLSDIEKEMKYLVEKRKELIKLREIESKHLARQRTGVYQAITEKVIRFLSQQIEELDGRIDAIRKKDSELQKKSERLQSVPGVGRATADTLLVLLPELGRMSKELLRALVGVAPYVKQSGTYNGHAHIGGGRQMVRNALYMCALTGTRCNHVLKSFYEKLVAKGKPKKVALVACMRKLLDILNALLAKKQLWDPSFSHQFSPAIA